MDRDRYTEIELKLRAECERGFTDVKRVSMALAPTGEPVIEMMAGYYGASDDECYDVALTTFRTYAKDKTGTLYWRIYPEIERGRFYMRLLITDKPPLASPQEMS